MGEGRERQACSKEKRRRGNETGWWLQPAGNVLVTERGMMVGGGEKAQR